MHGLFSAAGIPCWVGGMLESSVGSSLCASLAMLENFLYPADIFPSERFYSVDLGQSPLELEASQDGIPGIRAPTSIPDPDEDRLRQWTLSESVIC